MMTLMERTIMPGDLVLAVDAFGRTNMRRAITPVVEGADFPVVWICSEAEWKAAESENREPEGIPFPFEDVRLAEDAHA